MGKGDKKTRRGKITKGSFGARRPRKVQNKAQKQELPLEKQLQPA